MILVICKKSSLFLKSILWTLVDNFIKKASLQHLTKKLSMNANIMQ